MQNDSVVNRKALADALIARRGVGTSSQVVLQEVAKRTGVSVATLSRIEREEFDPALPVYVKLIRWLGVPFDRFIIG